MNTFETDDTIERLRGLWPKWEPTAAELAVWRERLMQRDHDAIHVAISDAFARSRYTTPKLGDVMAHYVAPERTDHDEAPQRHEPPCDDCPHRSVMVDLLRRMQRSRLDHLARAGDGRSCGYALVQRHDLHGVELANDPNDWPDEVIWLVWWSAKRLRWLDSELPPVTVGAGPISTRGTIG